MSSARFHKIKILFEQAATWSLPERYRWQKCTFQRKYNNFENKFSKIDKKFVSQWSLEVDPFHLQQKVVFFQQPRFYNRKSYCKFDEFWWISMNLVVFWWIWMKYQLLESIARRIFYRFWKTFFQSCRIFGGKSIFAIYTVLGAITQLPAQIV